MLDEDKEWIDYLERFSDRYNDLNYRTSLQGWVMQKSHALLEKDYDSNVFFSRVLEVGAGGGEHFSFVRHKFSEYYVTDWNSKSINIAKNELAKAGSEKKIFFKVEDGSRLSYPDNSFDRLIAMHLLEHIYQPHLALKEWRRVIKNNGLLSILIPTDPGLAWQFGRYFGPRRNAVKNGIAYDYVMAREHVNSCHNLVALLRYYFPNIKEVWWPFRIPSVNLNLFYAIHARISK